jgi:hypothetical protein
MTKRQHRLGSFLTRGARTRPLATFVGFALFLAILGFTTGFLRERWVERATVGASLVMAAIGAGVLGAVGVVGVVVYCVKARATSHSAEVTR